jgi:hypothetical protein
MFGKIVRLDKEVLKLDRPIGRAGSKPAFRRLYADAIKQGLLGCFKHPSFRHRSWKDIREPIVVLGKPYIYEPCLKRLLNEHNLRFQVPKCLAPH